MSKKLHYLGNTSQQEPGEFTWDCILSMMYQEEQNVKLERGEFINMRAVSCDPRFIQHQGPQETVLICC